MKTTTKEIAKIIRDLLSWSELELFVHALASSDVERNGAVVSSLLAELAATAPGIGQLVADEIEKCSK